MRLYAMKDCISESFGPLMMFVNDAVAVRATKEALEKPSKLQKQAKDFDLYYIGEFDERSGELGQVKTEMIRNCGSLVLELEQEKRKVQPELPLPGESRVDKGQAITTGLEVGA